MMTSKLMYWLAAGLSLLGLVAHEALGAPMVLPPLLAADLAEEVIWLLNFSWHVGSVAVAAIVVLFVRAARAPGNIFVVCIAVGMSAGFAVLGISLALFGSGVMWGTPAPYIWSVVAVIGASGLGLELSAGSSALH